MTAPRRTSRPPTRPAVPADAAAVMVKQILKDNHRLDVPLGYLVFVEGTTDVAYLECAAHRMKERCGFDLLGLEGSEQDCRAMRICTPLNPRAAGNRGGIPQLVRLADDLKQHVLYFETVRPVCFVFDHDREGIEAAKTIRESHKYTTDIARPITLDPKEHQGACRYCGKGERPVVVEDLLSLSIQKRFFEVGTRYCDVSYENGEIVRFEWREPSKSELCEFVCKEAGAEDVRELAKVLLRIRHQWRLQVSPEVAGFVAGQ